MSFLFSCQLLSSVSVSTVYNCFRQLQPGVTTDWPLGFVFTAWDLQYHPVFALLQTMFYSRITSNLIYTENLLVITIN